MILNTTYLDKNKVRQIYKVVGEPISFWKRLTSTVGSHRMVVESYSADFNQHLKNGQNILYANIELRPKGIIVRFSVKYSTISWLIPYHKLVIYQSENFSIYSDSNFVKFRRDNNFTMNKGFLKSMMDKKSSSHMINVF
tara:strand:+ start:2711 stop:3127 length:417 start_codon:yes stop_codon:yes gene_type:complete